ncbi:CAP domain-containing protein [Saccharopolyspora sp. MS10]|uniref:CAP domain-containing protein n=1 Tax=Saccharopolyspora sp. MS10 TaxID=3385973 RepID=UPI0039A02743
MSALSRPASSRPLLLSAVLAAALAAPSTQAAPPAGGTAEIVDRTNAARAESGCGPLAPVPELDRSAQAHAADMATNDFFAHSDATSPARSGGAGPPVPLPEGRAGENIAAGNATAAETFDQWMTSPEHRANIQNCGFTGIGVGHAFDPRSTYGHYWVQEFSGP